MGYCGDDNNNINVEKLKKQCTQYKYNNSNIYATIRLNNKIYIYIWKKM